jgi:hypothetical protein
LDNSEPTDPLSQTIPSNLAAEVDDDMISLFEENVPLYNRLVNKASSGLYSNMNAFDDGVDESMGPYDPRLEDEYQCKSIMGRSVMLPSHSLLLTSSDPQASVIYPPSDQGTCMIEILFACISAESKYFAHCSICCKCQEERNHQDWILDSGASVHFTNCKEDFVYYTEMEDGPAMQTASDTINIEGCGTVYIQFKLKGKDSYFKLTPVYYISEMTLSLMSMGEFLQNGHTVSGDWQNISIHCNSSDKSCVLSAKPHSSGQTIYWVYAKTIVEESLGNVLMNIFVVNYDIWHQHFGHPSKDVLMKAKKHTKNFPQDLEIPKETSICQGCTKGKMPAGSHLLSDTRAKAPFKKIYTDLKSFPKISYHKYWYFISFLNNYSSFCWIVLLKTKDQALKAFRYFIAWVDTQYKTKIQSVMSDFGGEYKSIKLEEFLKEFDIKVFASAPLTP